MSNKIYFTPGPSQLYPGVGEFIQEALENDVPSISHRSQAFKDIFGETVSQLRTLINLPDDYHVLFSGSATEIWERFLHSCVEKKSFHFVNGSFSKRFYQYAQGCGFEVDKLEAEFGSGFNLDDVSIANDTEAICVTHNETSSGVSFPLEDIYTLRHQHPDKLIAVDVVSSLPNPEIDFTKIDCALFSVQKCFGLPAGLGVWLVNDRCLDKMLQLKEKGILTGPHHELDDLITRAKGNQTPATPNVLGIYLLGKVCQAMNKKGVDTIRKETRDKAEKLYQFIAESEILSPAVENPAHRSETVIVANTKRLPSEINKHLAPYNMIVGSGYGAYKETQIRIANFPAHSADSVNELIEMLKTQEAYA